MYPAMQRWTGEKRRTITIKETAGGEIGVFASFSACAIGMSRSLDEAFAEAEVAIAAELRREDAREARERQIASAP